MSDFSTSLAEFAAGIGHELNNPLASIGGRVQLLMRSTTDPQLRRDLAEIISEVRRAGDLIADIRLYACPPEPVFTCFNLSDCLSKTANGFHDIVSSLDIGLTLDLPANPVEISADYSQINVLFQALIRNSIEALSVAETDKGSSENLSQFNSSKKQIAVLLKELPDKIIVCVSDNGPGITPEQQPHIFDPYYSARQANRGLGFGLCKAFKIAQMHKAVISVESEPNVRTVFKIEFTLGTF